MSPILCGFVLSLYMEIIMNNVTPDHFGPNPSYYLTCSKCKSALKMEDYAIDTQTCQNKHTFFLRCPECDGFSATAMRNIPQALWTDFIAADKLDEAVNAYNVAMKKG